MASDQGPDIAALVRRIEALEMHAADRDRVVEDLNATITAQWKAIDGFERQLRRLGEQVSELEAPGGAPEPPPPHY